MDTLETFADADDVTISYRVWRPGESPRAIVEIAHGASEHSGRYARLRRARVVEGAYARLIRPLRARA